MKNPEFTKWKENDGKDFGGSVILDTNGYLISDCNVSNRSEKECKAIAKQIIQSHNYLIELIEMYGDKNKLNFIEQSLLNSAKEIIKSTE